MLTRLKAGTKAPGFNALSLDGRTLSLTAFKGRLVWLMFYRYPGCPLCNLHMSSVLIRREVLEKFGVTILVVFESHARHFPAGFHLKRLERMFFISDPELTLYQHYGIENRLAAAVRPGVLMKWLVALFKGFRQGKIQGDLGRIPAHFLIDEKGTINRSYYGKHIGDHIPFHQVEKFLNERLGGEFSLALPKEA